MSSGQRKLTLHFLPGLFCVCLGCVGIYLTYGLLYATPFLFAMFLFIVRWPYSNTALKESVVFGLVLLVGGFLVYLSQYR